MTLKKTNNPRFSTAFRKSPLSERFHKSFTINKETECWEWIGTIHVTGYGIIQDNNIDLLAHRYAYLWYIGEPGKLCVLHKCDNRKCVNPNHLFLGTRRDNNRDRDSKGRGPVGERNWCTKLTAEDIPKIRQLHEEGWKQKEIAKRYGVHQGTISHVVNKTTWKHI